MTDGEPNLNPYQSPRSGTESRSIDRSRFARYAAGLLFAFAVIVALHVMVQDEILQEREWRAAKTELTWIGVLYVRACHWLYDFGILVDLAIIAVGVGVSAIPDLRQRHANRALRKRAFMRGRARRRPTDKRG
jgi:hypothetical protein